MANSVIKMQRDSFRFIFSYCLVMLVTLRCNI